MGKYKHNHNKNNDEEEIAKQNINRTKLLIYSPSKSLPSAPGRILIDNRRTIRRSRRNQQRLNGSTKRKKKLFASTNKYKKRLLSKPKHYPLPEIPASLTNLYDRYEMRISLPASRPTAVQSFVIEKYIKDENMRTMKARTLKKGDEKLKQNKLKIRRLLTTLHESRQYDLSAIKIQRYYRRYYRSKYYLSAAKIIWWYKKLLAEWKYREFKAQQQFKRFQLRFLLKVLKSWHTWAYQNKMVERKVKKILAGMQLKCISSWHEWTVKVKRVKQIIQESQRKRSITSHFNALKEYYIKMVNVKNFIRKICAGVQQRFYIEWHEYVKQRVSARSIQCSYRVYAAKKVLFRKRRRQICKKISSQAIDKAHRIVVRWIRRKKTLKIQQMFRGFMSRKSTARLYLNVLNQEKQRSSSEKKAVLDAGRAAALICLRRYNIFKSSRKHRKKDYKDLNKRFQMLKKEAKQLILYSPDQKDLINKKSLDDNNKTKSNIVIRHKLHNAREAFAVYDPAKISKIRSIYLQPLLIEAKLPITKEEALLLNRILPRADGYVHERDFLNYIKADIVHVSVTGKDENKRSISMNYFEKMFRGVELEFIVKKRNLFSNLRVNNLALRLLLLEAQCEGMCFARKRFRVCYNAPFTCPLCHRDFLLASHFLDHLGASLFEVKLKNLSVERAKRIMDVRKPNECQPRTLQRFFEENFGNDLVDELLEKVKV